MNRRTRLRQSPAIEGYLAMTGRSLLCRPRGMARDQGEELPHRMRREMERDALRIGRPADPPAEDERRRQIAELIGACAAGDRPAFRRLYDLTSRFVCGIIRAILRDSEMVAEVAQEVYVSIWQRAGSFDDETRNPLAWI